MYKLFFQIALIGKLGHIFDQSKLLLTTGIAFS